MKTCIAGALGVNTNTLPKAWQSELGHAIEPLLKPTRSCGERNT
jgi:hypothetical protein